MAIDFLMVLHTLCFHNWYSKILRLVFFFGILDVCNVSSSLATMFLSIFLTITLFTIP